MKVHGNCPECSSPIIGRKRIFCNAQCGEKYRYRHNKQHRYDNCKCGNRKMATSEQCKQCLNPRRKEIVCKCGKVFTPARARDRHCSPRCGWKYADRSGTVKTNQEASRLRVIARIVAVISTKYIGKHTMVSRCDYCGRYHEQDTSFCSYRCSAEWGREEYRLENGIVLHEHTCRECGCRFDRHARNQGDALYCSSACCGRAAKRRRRHNGKERASTVSVAIRRKVFRRDHYKCCYCNEQVSMVNFPDVREPHDATVDHIVPVAKGGVDEMWNLVTACCSCNSKKHASIRGEAQLCLL